MAAALFVTIAVATHAYVVRSEAYRVAERFAESNEAVREIVGDVGSTRLGFGNLGIRSSEPYSAVNFTMVIHGDRGNAAIVFVLIKRDDNRDWIIDKATLEGSRESVNLLGDTPDDTRNLH